MLTAILITAGIALTGGGVGGFFIAKGIDRPAVEEARAEAEEARADAVEARADARALRDVTQSQVDLAASLSAPAQVEAEVVQELARKTPACARAADGVACMVQLCWAFGQSKANRPECSDYQTLHTDGLRAGLTSCPEPEP